MNIRRNIDYRELFDAVKAVIAENLSQMELYREIGRLVSQRPEKGAAVAVAEHLTARYPDTPGFSPRNLRRMRDFYRTYASAPELLKLAMNVGWTQNVVILETDLTLEERGWYLRATAQNGWSKAELLRQIEAAVHREMTLDEAPAVCYTKEKEIQTECANDDKDTFSVPREHLPVSHGRVCDERFGEESGPGGPVPHRIRRHQHRGDRQSGLSPGSSQVGRARH
jgi:predicted nuclease of restriction endonuclease-like (RecB) superfamily